MTWTTPRTWAADDSVTAPLLNEQIRDNFAALKSPASGDYTLDEVSNYTTTSATFVDVDATNLALSIITVGGPVLVHFHAGVEHSSPSYVCFDITLDGTRAGGDDGIVRARPYAAGGNGQVSVGFSYLITPVATGAHTIKLQWKTGAATATLYAGAGTANGRDIHPQFWAREVS